MSTRPTILLMILAVTLGSILVWEIRRGPAPAAGIDAAGEAATQRAAPSTPPVPSLPPLAQLTATVARPLFSEDRRPAETGSDSVVETAAAAPAAATSGVVLSAIVIDGDQRRALLRDPSTGRSVWLSRGDTLAGWSLASIRADSVTLRNGAHSETVPLRRFDRTQPPPPRPPAGAGPAAPRPRSAGAPQTPPAAPPSE